MRRSLRRDLRLLQACTVVSSLGWVFIAVAAFGPGVVARARSSPDGAAQPAAPQKIDELTVQRINVVDTNGTLRLVIANKDRMHPGIMDGVTINRPRPVAGLIFFNDEGDEVGGLAYSGEERDGQRRAGAQLAFDQLKQDQTVAISYSENNGQRTAGLQVWDRSETRLSELIRKLNDANALADPAAREKAVQAARAGAPPGPRRVFVGKTSDKASTVSLADANGKPRLVMKVEADGAASVEFLDADGKSIRRLGPQ